MEGKKNNFESRSRLCLICIFVSSILTFFIFSLSSINKNYADVFSEKYYWSPNSFISHNVSMDYIRQFGLDFIHGIIIIENTSDDSIGLMGACFYDIHDNPSAFLIERSKLGIEIVKGDRHRKFSKALAERNICKIALSRSVF